MPGPWVPLVGKRTGTYPRITGYVPSANDTSGRVVVDVGQARAGAHQALGPHDLLERFAGHQLLFQHQVVDALAGGERLARDLGGRGVADERIEGGDQPDRMLDRAAEVRLV